MVTVLLVDDDVSAREAVTTALEAAGHKVVEAGTAREARAAVAGSDEPFDVIVADVRLAELPGPELVAELRLLQPRAVCVLISDDPEIEDLEALDAPLFRSDELTTKIAEFF